jgi:hypothetical protein
MLIVFRKCKNKVGNFCVVCQTRSLKDWVMPNLLVSYYSLSHSLSIAYVLKLD